MDERRDRTNAGEPPLLLLHGFTGGADTWAEAIARFPPRRRVLAIDLPGHGPLPAEARTRGGIRIEDAVAAVLGFLDDLDLARVDLLGYSMGGRVALRMALDHPGRVRALVIESASPGIADDAERAARRRADDEMADRIGRDGLDAFVDQWMAQPLFATQARLPAGARDRERAMRMRGDPAGLAACLRGMGQGAMAPMWDALPSLQAPALLLAGELDAKYRDLAAKMAARMSRARVVIVPGAGHAAHLEAPGAFTELVDRFLTELDGNPQGDPR
jgi:2-succinyl-6-hydroxy-2,4-cyclohexadiene-1-carboxylate synthase